MLACAVVEKHGLPQLSPKERARSKTQPTVRTLPTRTSRATTLAAGGQTAALQSALKTASPVGAAGDGSGGLETVTLRPASSVGSASPSASWSLVSAAEGTTW